ncbi:MAG: SulP family inorganic anion transporter [Planctomycetia bacterium]|nr:SulP family inorganic anion transporter [Planctomycetia bacterium]
MPDSPNSWRERFFRLVPAFDSLRTYSWGVLGLDTMAGLTVAAVAVPQAMAYAQIAGVPPQYGLYTAIVMTTVGALFDSSKQLINGPTNAISIAVLSAVVGFSEAERIPAVILLALMVGLVQTGITLLRLGDLTRYISHAVIVGFTLGAAVLLVLDQLKNLLGLTAQGSGEDHFLKRFWLTMSHIGEVSYATISVGVATIAIALALHWVNLRWRLRLPEFLLALICVATAVWGWGLDQQGVKVVGTIPPELPSFGLPEIEWSRVRELAGSSAAIALLGLLEAIAMAKAIANHTRQKLDMNQQCLSEGLANLAGSLFHCFPGSGSLTRSTINHLAGATTQWSGVISAAVVALTVVLFAPYAYYIPRSGLAGILILSAWRLVDRRELAYHLRTTRYDASIVVLTALSAVAISVEFCVMIGVFMSFVLYVPQAARVHITELTLTPERVLRERIATDPVCNRIRIYSLEGELFFGAAPELEEHLGAVGETVKLGVRVIVLRLKRARNTDAVCLSVFDRFITRMQAENVTVLLCGLRPDLVKVIESSGLRRRLGPERVFVFEETGAIWSSTLEAVRFAYEIIGQNVCGNCPRHAKSLEEKDGWYFMI